MSSEKKVPGKKPDAGDLGSSHVDGQKSKPGDTGRKGCAPCQRGGRQVNAHGFCRDCAEFLCSGCFDFHRNARLLERHMLLTMNEMPKVLPRKFQDLALTDTCPRHINEFIKFYCSEHDAVVCVVCRQVKHAVCKVEFIPDVVIEYSKSEDFADIMDILKALSKNSDVIKGQANQNLSNVHQIHDMTIGQLGEFRTEINKYLDKREEELTSKAGEIKARDEHRMADVKHRGEALEKDIETHQSRIKKCLQSETKLFISAKQAKSELNVFKERLRILSAQNVVQEYEFKPHSEMQKVISQGRSIGEIKFHPSTTKRPKGQLKSIALKLNEKKIYKSSQDKKPQCISSIAVINDNLLAIANLDHTVKTLCLNNNKIIHERKLLCQPWDIAKVREDTIAVTLPAKKRITFLNVDEGLSESDFLDVSGMCLGLEFTDNTFVVSFNKPPNVEIIDRSGHVLRSIDKDELGIPIFTNPTYLTVVNMRDGNNILVSDGQCVFQLSMGGCLLSKLSFEGHARPMGIASFRDGIVGICDRKSDTIHLLTDDGWTLTNVNTLKCDMYPHVITVNQKIGVVYVSFDNGVLRQQNYIRVYNIDQ